ncbi:MAG: ribonuclease D [Porticoccaceae bacterium]|nr:ribonuclease D [Porticoccaceae bacterium]MDG1474977.1 ribonuclease D [Porticoccaceae bacterium]
MAHWIDSNEKLMLALQKLQTVDVLALDTEFIRTNTFYPKIALIQISDGNDCWLIDVLGISDFTGLKTLLEDSSNTLIFHACAEDLEVLDHALNIVPTGIFDTQLAASLLNIGQSLGYAALVKKLFDIELDKQETRSDWLARPLTARQLDYAEVDVIYLHRLFAVLQQHLAEIGRVGWLTEELDALHCLVEGRKVNDNYYHRFKSAWKLEHSSLRILKRLCDWREAVARDQNKPRGHIIKDNSIFEIARRAPTVLAQLNGIDDLHPGLIKRYGLDILDQIAKASVDVFPPSLSKPLSKGETLVLRSMRDALIVVADEEGIPPGTLFTKKELELVLRASMGSKDQWPERYIVGWRGPLVKPVLEKVLVESCV